MTIIIMILAAVAAWLGLADETATEPTTVNTATFPPSGVDAAGPEPTAGPATNPLSVPAAVDPPEASASPSVADASGEVDDCPHEREWRCTLPTRELVVVEDPVTGEITRVDANTGALVDVVRAGDMTAREAELREQADSDGYVDVDGDGDPDLRVEVHADESPPDPPDPDQERDGMVATITDIDDVLVEVGP